jgi:cell division protein FtsW (lipid II flippase)/cell division protein FtsI/penicillin-binding protein 2
MKVNLSLLGLTFQPSEIAKYLIVFFMAAFFTSTADSIIAYSRPNHTNVWNKFKTLAWLLVGLVVLMAIYAVLGDMGPALIIAVTFILLYSLVKSKVNLDNMPEEEKWKRIFTCDFAVLIYGILSFALFTYLGYKIGNSLIFSLLWFVVWIGVGLSRNKQFFESAFFFNLIVFIFIFGGEILTKIPTFEHSDTAIRFEQRTRMCVNTWGDLDIIHNGNDAEPVSNTQVANGLWAIATGGMAGQGLGDGNPNLIPAFHTDMILSSIAEQTGWRGLVCVVLILALLLRRMIVIGYRVGHPFAFYFCMGVAIVTAVQFFIIALGSSGMIPLTGVTVPFISYGKVSMILNLVALGVIMSMSKNISTENLQDSSATIENIRKRSVGDYNYPVSIVSWTFLVLALFTLGVWQYYALWARSKTLVHPAFVLNNQGLPLIEYNPRIALLTREMWAGNIYDRNGVLLATSDREKLTDDYIKLLLSGIDSEDKHNGLKVDSIKQRFEKTRKAHTRRYYPFAEQLFFMLGDQYTGLYFTYDEENPIGYMAEAQHLSYLRDYDNTYYDKQHNPVKVRLKGKVKNNARYIRSEASDTIVSYRLRDNKPLVKYLKTGVQGKPFKKHNKDVQDGDFDLHLTLDAILQTNLQNRICSYVEKTPTLKNNNLLRISVVVLDAENGELLASANYPLPNYERLREEDKLGHHSYSDNCKGNSWSSYTDRDLGLTYQTMPGSTAKVMSAIAGFQRLGTSAADKKYLVTAEDIVETGKAPEPHGYKVPMRDAIVHSSNCYFIHLINENDLYWELDSIYETVGVSIGNSTPYYLSYARDEVKQKTIREKVRQNKSKALSKYSKRMEDGVHKKMNEGEWRWAWGQGYENYELQASPLNMARIASAVVNNGVMPYTQFLLPANKYGKKHIETGSVRLLSAPSADILKEYMLAESSNQKPRNSVVLPSFVGGKTGTPERYRIDKDIRFYNKWIRKYQTRQHIEKRNDGWYMFFVEGQGEKHPLAVAVRMERSTGSGAAVRLTKSVVLEALYENGYINKK